MPDKPTLQHFETFLMVAEQGSFTAAANKLGLSKAAISQAIRLLENSLQMPLFIRSTRRIELTDAGKLLMIQCKRLQIELDAARDLVQNYKAKPSGTLRINCNPYLLESRYLNVIQKFQKKFPQVNLEIFADERIPDMQQEQIDCVLGVNWPAPEDVVAKKIGKTRYVLCAAPAYLKKHGIPKNIEDLENHICVPHSGRKKGSALIDLKKEINITCKMPLKINNANIIKKCGVAGMGIIQLHDYMLMEELQTGKLIEILPEYFQPEIPLYIYYQKYRFVQPKVRQFVNLFL